MDSQKLTDAYWTLLTCRESTEIWIRLAGSSSTLSKPRGQLRFAACRVGGRRGFHLSDRYICPSTFYSQVHHSSTHAHLLAETSQTSKAQAHTTVSRPLSLRVRLLERHVYLGGASGALFFSNGLVQVLQNVAICFNDRE